MGRLGWVPEVGDEVALDGYSLYVEQVEGSRVVRLAAREDGSEQHPPDEG